MADYKYDSAKKMNNYLQKAQRLGSLLNQPGLDQIFPLGIPENTTTPHRPSANRTMQNKPPVNRPNQNRNRPVQNNSKPNRPNKNQNKTLERTKNSKGTGKESALSPSTTQGNGSTINSKDIKDMHNASYQEGQDITMQSNSLKNLLNFSNMNSEDILKGFIFSEIIGKPKALRRGRW